MHTRKGYNMAQIAIPSQGNPTVQIRSVHSLQKKNQICQHLALLSFHLYLKTAITRSFSSSPTSVPIIPSM